METRTNLNLDVHVIECILSLLSLLDNIGEYVCFAMSFGMGNLCCTASTLQNVLLRISDSVYATISAEITSLALKVS